MTVTRAKAKAVIAKCDRLFSYIVRSVDVCANCGDSYALQCAHGFSRRYRSVRWDERNAFCLCRRCHVYFTHRPIEWDDWLRDRLGDSQYRAVRELALSGVKTDVPAVLERLETRWKAMQ